MNTQTQSNSDAVMRAALKMAIEALETCITYNPYEQGFNTELVETALESGKEVLKNLEKDPSISRKAQPTITITLEKDPAAEVHPELYEQMMAYRGISKPAQENEASSLREPVAIVETHYGFTDAIVTFLTENNEQLPIGTLLYTHPAPEQNKSVKQWQGLSDDELSELFAKCGWVEEGDNLHELGFYKHARMLEKALKEKNGH